MLKPVEVILERVSANDTSVTVVAILRASGSRVMRGDRLLDVETSKAVHEVEAPADGVLTHSLRIGDTLSFGSAIAQIMPAEAGAPEELAAAPPSTRSAEAPGSEEANPHGAAAKTPPRFSRDARALAQQYGLKPEDFDGPFITAEEVEQRYRRMQAQSPSDTGAPPAAERTAAEDRRGISGEPVPPWKQDQIAALERGAAASMLSVIGSFLGAPAQARPGAGFFESRITDLVAYEASRLMLQFRRFNAAWRHQAIEYHGSVNAGIAFGGESGLLVYGIAGSDKLSLPALQDEIVNGFRGYAQNNLRRHDLVRPTFIITDLSTAGVEFIVPLLPEGQSCIIGITKSPDRGFGLFIGFDHRVTDGFEAARFLNQLRQRLLDHLAAPA